VETANTEQETAPDAADVTAGQDDVVPEPKTSSGAALGPEGETTIPSTSPVVDALREQLASVQESAPPASPTIIMPTTREPEPSPTTGLAPRSASQPPPDIQMPQT